MVGKHDYSVHNTEFLDAFKENELTRQQQLNNRFLIQRTLKNKLLYIFVVVVATFVFIFVQKIRMLLLGIYGLGNCN